MKTVKKTSVKKYQGGGSTKKNPKSYSESDFSDGAQMNTRVQGPKGYKKEIKWEASGAGNSNKKPYTMTVTKGGKTNTFVLSEEQARNQRKIAKKEAGYKKGGATGVGKSITTKKGSMATMSKTPLTPKAAYGMAVKPGMMKKGGKMKSK